jgi:hypothetical protein
VDELRGEDAAREIRADDANVAKGLSRDVERSRGASFSVLLGLTKVLRMAGVEPATRRSSISVLYRWSYIRVCGSKGEERPS